MIYAHESPVASIKESFDFPCLDESQEAAVQAECVANARLIAAAPDLLEACKAALEVIEGDADEFVVAVRHSLKTAIAKAEGK